LKGTIYMLLCLGKGSLVNCLTFFLKKLLLNNVGDDKCDLYLVSMEQIDVEDPLFYQLDEQEDG